MIILYHNNKSVTQVISTEGRALSFSEKNSITTELLILAATFPEEKIVWCHCALESQLNVDFIQKNETYNNTLFSFNPYPTPYLTDAIGYVENSVFININKANTYPTWLMSGSAGYAHASVFLNADDAVSTANDFDYFLNSLAKKHMPLGLFCYSEPRLLKSTSAFSEIKARKTSRFTLFKFVKEHYRTRWVFLLLLDFLIYEKKIPLLPLLFSLSYKKKSVESYNLTEVSLLKHSGITEEDTIDVLIPTIGRKKYLYDVLLDLKKQNILPKNVIIIEQNGDVTASSELDYLTTEDWPFTILHTFTHTLGACNARNLALEQLKSKWVFFADDDVRIDADFLHQCLLNCKNYDKKALTLSCLQKGEKFIETKPFQWVSFGTCSSFVASEVLVDIRFSKSFEFGYGEDSDFGKKIRNAGTDVVFFSNPKLLHLKAPMGGFRTKFKFDWSDEKYQPKPSPTVMLYKLTHETTEEINGYKTLLFLKSFGKQGIKNPFRFYTTLKKQWNTSVFWAQKLKERN
ncbi:glycosyltransferase family 2 protein [Flavobacterium silvisoli]|uniref:Glycosyltransferase family 2 protein n=1 Tax=Flavobacterium silvisoli TaxID=2529433 RepID=A0A4V2L5K5_9FLAO|nr:glycosyltransferase family A protein [Flavobacterium silvisoli]TBX71021.1 glycosyltransferase family 2 protein [Flavobacterium silvisoli]